ncbi:oxidoreductase [Mycolicibacterium madagascariense]|uniref:Oxidoreductase n=1 Tax=Mycolicibacterium madagascariense TaxID=212765 RepID=A0A7I7XHY8_9MYCO|nr:oxidoreductase [Mycolicibacterium madagascariense]
MVWPVRGMIARALWCGAAASMVLVPLSWWAQSGGWVRLSDPSEAMPSAGMAIGLVASVLMVWQIVLVARIPWLERTWGQDRLVRAHRIVGFTSFVLVVSHISLFAGHRVIQYPGDAARGLWYLFVVRPWFLFATFGTVLIVVAVVSSVRRSRARLRYESWHLLHLYTYLGMGFALPHQIFAGRDLDDHAHRFVWGIAWGLAAGALLAFRVIAPIFRSLRHGLRVDSVREEVDGLVSVTVTGRHLQALRARAGQFFVWRFLDGPGWSRGHPFSLSAAPTVTSLRVTVHMRGDGSNRLAGLLPGTPVLAEGPYGVMTLERRRHPHVLFLAAGVGLAPLHAMLDAAHFAPGEATLVYRCRPDGRALFAAELEELTDVRVVRLVGHRRSPHSWLPVDDDHPGADHVVLGELAPHIAHSDVYLCGPPGWVTSVKRAARQAGVRRNALHVEEFSW